MKTYSTIVRAISPDTGLLTIYEGPYVQAISESDARRILDTTGNGYCHVDLVVDSEIDELTGKVTIFHNNN